MRLVRIDGIEYRGAGAPSRRELHARVGPGLIETMRARDGRIAHRAWHLGRLAASIRTLGLVDAPDAAGIERSLDAALAGFRARDALVRLVVGAGGVYGVEVAPIDPLPSVPRECTAITVPGGWVPADADAEHKRTDRSHWDRVEGAAAAAGADIALMTDRQALLPNAHIFEADSIQIRARPRQSVSVDGSLVGKTPVRFGVAPQALRVLVPGAVPGPGSAS